VATITQWTSCVLRVFLCALLIKFTRLSIVGAAISANCCYLLATILNLCYIISVKNNTNGNDKNEDNFNKFGNRGRRPFQKSRKGT
jgi:Na+-driven multidrug efflux pump